MFHLDVRTIVDSIQWPTALLVPAATLCGITIAAVMMRGRRHFPPGPTGLPLLKNMFDVPKNSPWIVYRDWGCKYQSSIIHMEALGTHIYVINDAEVCKEIFEKRSRIYSDKAHGIMVCELVGWDKSFGVMPYGDEWRTHRKMFNQHFRPGSISEYHPKMLKEARVLVDLIADTPDDFLRHIRYVSGTIILGVVYGSEIQSQDDPILAAAEEAVHAFSEAAEAGSYLVDHIPILKYVPEWFPGAEFKRQASRWKATIDNLFELPYRTVKNAMLTGSANTSVTSSLLSTHNPTQDAPEMDKVIRNVAGVAYAAGSDTTVLMIQSFVLAMITHPEAQRAAHEQLDLVLGHARLPTFDDRESLPYITAIVLEVLRWRPPGPLAMPHWSTADDTYDGYFIPAGSMMIGNAWAILHDESRYPNAAAFDPSRFLAADGHLDPSVPDPAEAFGFGRRICPGRHFALDAAWIAVAQLLAAFSIEKAADGAGGVVEPSVEYSSGILAEAVPGLVQATRYRTVLRVRSRHEDLTQWGKALA